jgi:predicted small lipoprotein YifL
MERSSLLLLLFLLALLGCNDPEHPDTLDLTGTYHATTFASTGFTGETRDLLALGASITLTLNADKTTAGRLYVPPADDSAPAVDEDLAGTWDIVGTTVTLDHEANTFLRRMEFVADGMRLTGQLLDPDNSFSVVLSK